MPSHGQIRLRKVWAMLDVCALGYRRVKRTHNWWVMYGEKTYRHLPLGPHGKQTNPDIQIGHVKNMVRHLGIDGCAKRELPHLFGR